jgi:hypothetical protein
MSFVSTDPVSHKGVTNTWLTPLHIINSLGVFDLDPCGFPGHETAKNKFIYPNKDGLKEEWYGRVWLNPPYGKEQQAWLDKLQNHGNGIALVFARLETKWIQPFLNDGFFQIEGRIKFLKQDFTEDSNAGTGSILIPFGRRNLGAILQSDLKGRYYK